MRTFRPARLPGFLTLLLVSICGLPMAAQAISITSFGSMGEAGITHGRPLGIAPGGEIFELDGFVSVNGGLSHRFSDGLLPTGLDLTFSASTSLDGTDLLLEYSFMNSSAANFLNVIFLTFLDAQIDDSSNGYYNEVALKTGTGSPGANFEIDEPGFLLGNIVQNILAGALDGTNTLPPGSPDDVSMALSFALGTLNPGQSRSVQVLISEDGDTLGGFTLIQFDPDPVSSTTVTFSAAALIPVPEPGWLMLMSIGIPILTLLHGDVLVRRGGISR